MNSRILAGLIKGFLTKESVNSFTLEAKKHASKKAQKTKLTKQIDAAPEVVKDESTKFSIKSSIKAYNLKAKKHLSQNFIVDGNLCRKVIKQAGRLKDCHVCEVGPGPGGLTNAILEQDVKQLSVIEKDERFFPALEELNKSRGGKMKFYQGDVLRFNMHEVFPDEISRRWEEHTPDAEIIGNLPFAISTPLIVRWLKEISLRQGAWSKGRVPLTLTFQKEVADRMISLHNDEERCRLSVICQAWCDIDYKFTIKGSQFQPAPKVDVGVVRFTPKINPEIHVPFDYVEKLVRQVFHYRRKMVKFGLRTLFPHDRPDLLVQLLEESHTHSDARPRELDMDDMRRLCEVYAKICDEHPGLLNYDYRSSENALLWRTELKPLGF